MCTPSALNSLDGPEAPQLVIYTGENRPAGDKTELLPALRTKDLSNCYKEVSRRDFWKVLSVLPYAKNSST